MSVTASDDVDASTTTDPSVTEQDQNVDDNKPSSPKIPSPNMSSSRGPVQLLRRQQQQQSGSSSNSPSRQDMTTPRDTTRIPSPTTVDMNSPMTKDTIDSSLLEAFANPMNRQYLLQLEAKLNDFVTQSKL